MQICIKQEDSKSGYETMIFKKLFALKSGATLMELMVVIAIIGIMAGIATPNIIGWLPGYRLRSAARDIVSCMQLAKLRAVKENARVVVIFDHLNDKYEAFVDNVPSEGNWVLDSAEAIVMQKTMPAGIDIQSFPSTTAYTFGFNSRGLSASGGDTVQIKNNKSNYRRIIINIAGNIRMEKSKDGTNWH